MTESNQPDSAEDCDQPGKTRTGWHPLPARMLDFALAAGFTVLEEVLVDETNDDENVGGIVAARVVS